MPVNVVCPPQFWHTTSFSPATRACAPSRLVRRSRSALRRSFSSTAPVASQADVTAARLQGDWIVVQGAGIAPGTVVRGTADGLTVQGVEYILTAPGRLSNADGRLWVHWLDIGDRTAAVGDPDGGRVWIMDREAGSSPDRLRAAREILDWYGYDLRRLAGLGRGMGS